MASKCVERTLLLERAMSICGLDFGTSNTTLGTMKAMRRFWRAGDRRDRYTSAIFLLRSGRCGLIGRRPSRPMSRARPAASCAAFKSVLGTSLIDETTRLGRERTVFAIVIGYYLGVCETARRTGHRPRIARRGAWPAGAFSSTTLTMPTARRSRPAGDCARDRLR